MYTPTPHVVFGISTFFWFLSSDCHNIWCDYKIILLRKFIQSPMATDTGQIRWRWRRSEFHFVKIIVVRIMNNCFHKFVSTWNVQCCSSNRWRNPFQNESHHNLQTFQLEPSAQHMFFSNFCESLQQINFSENILRFWWTKEHYRIVWMKSRLM